MKKYLIGIFLFLGFMGFVGYFLWTKSIQYTPPIKQKEPVLPIQVLKKQKFTYTKDFIGSVEATQSVDVVPYLSGFLTTVLVHSGQEVEQGQTLFLLDERIPLADLNQAKEAVSQAYATRANALTLYQRMQNTSSKAISLTDLEQAKTEFEAADAAYQKALAAQNQAQTLYDYTIISASISGWVGNITATPGEYLSPESKVLAKIIRFSPIRLTFSVPMSTYHLEKPLTDGILQVVLASQKTVEFHDFKIMSDNHADTSTDSLSFFVDVPNEDKKFVPGTYVEIRFLFNETGILVDKNWITLTPNGNKAFILSDGIVTERIVQIGATLQNQYWIQSGLTEGEKIITVPVSPYQIEQPAQGATP